MSMQSEVWITGVGAITPLGNDVQTFTDNLLAGQSGVRSNELAGRGSDAAVSTASVGDIPTPAQWDQMDFARRNRLEQLSLACTVTAV